MEGSDWHDDPLDRKIAELRAQAERDRKESVQLWLAWLGLSLAAAGIDYAAQRDWWAWVVWPVVIGILFFVVFLVSAVGEVRSATGRNLAAFLGATALIYALIWEGGNLSFDYTHKCVRSHVEQVVDREGNQSSVRVCDFFTANDKRWTLLDPIRVIARH